MSESNEFYTLDQVANKLFISTGTARNRLTNKSRMPPSFRVGRRRLFPIGEFNKWLLTLREEAIGQKK